MAEATAERVSGKGKGSRCPRATAKQNEYLLDYMATHSNFAAGRFMGLQGKKQQSDQWDRLTEQLNLYGPKRDKSQWQKNWSDLKSRPWKKVSSIGQNMRQTGNPPGAGSMTDVEKKILSVIGKDSALGNEDVQDSMDSPQVRFDLESMEFVLQSDDDNVPDDRALNDQDLPLSCVGAENTESLDAIIPHPTEDKDTDGDAGSSGWPDEAGNFPQPATVAPPARDTPFSEASPRTLAPRTLAPMTPGKRQRTQSEGQGSAAKRHFTGLREERRRREDAAAATRESFLTLEKQKVQHNELTARAFMMMAENEKNRLALEERRLELDIQRLEQDKLTAAAFQALAATMLELSGTLRKKE